MCTSVLLYLVVVVCRLLLVRHQIKMAKFRFQKLDKQVSRILILVHLI